MPRASNGLGPLRRSATTPKWVWNTIGAFTVVSPPDPANWSCRKLGKSSLQASPHAIEWLVDSATLTASWNPPNPLLYRRLSLQHPLPPPLHTPQNPLPPPPHLLPPRLQPRSLSYASQSDKTRNFSDYIVFGDLYYTGYHPRRYFCRQVVGHQYV